jgi:hypothetical protein
MRESWHYNGQEKQMKQSGGIRTIASRILPSIATTSLAQDAPERIHIWLSVLHHAREVRLSDEN